jgi:hypothetical protein
MAHQARYVVTKAPGVGGDPIPPDEPCLVIRANDILAREMIAVYVIKYRDYPEAQQKVLDELVEHYLAICSWQKEHQTRIADR